MLPMLKHEVEGVFGYVSARRPARTSAVRVRSDGTRPWLVENAPKRVSPQLPPPKHNEPGQSRPGQPSVADGLGNVRGAKCLVHYSLLPYP
jgi:hypothetical protein